MMTMSSHGRRVQNLLPHCVFRPPTVDVMSEYASVVAGSDLTEGLPASSGQERPPDRLSTVSFRILQREEEAAVQDEGR